MECVHLWNTLMRAFIDTKNTQLTQLTDGLKLLGMIHFVMKLTEVSETLQSKILEMARQLSCQGRQMERVALLMKGSSDLLPRWVTFPALSPECITELLAFLTLNGPSQFREFASVSADIEEILLSWYEWRKMLFSWYRPFDVETCHRLEMLSITRPYVPDKMCICDDMCADCNSEFTTSVSDCPYE